MPLPMDLRNKEVIAKLDMLDKRSKETTKGMSKLEKTLIAAKEWSMLTCDYMIRTYTLPTTIRKAVRNEFREYVHLGGVGDYMAFKIGVASALTGYMMAGFSIWIYNDYLPAEIIAGTNILSAIHEMRRSITKSTSHA